LANSDSMLAGNSEMFASSISEVKDLAVKGADEKTLDLVLRKIYGQIKSGVSQVQPVVVPIQIVNETVALEPEIKVKQVKKPRKKSPLKGQAALDLGDGQ